MIVQLTGKVKFPITLDPTVWIFDDRKVTFSEAFEGGPSETTPEEEDELKRKSLRFDREVYQQKLNPPVNKSINRYEKQRIINGTFLMPLLPFLQTSEPSVQAEKAALVSDEGEEIVQADDLKDALLLFAENGKPLKTDGPVHLYFGDGSNKETPVKGIKKIVFQ
ncbi:hypothetical protein GLW04_04065 [Halobacillus litoralis]|uniref:Peptidyl-prolyl cis-trans isomerase n=1 Tax=Halobacillus litoralis TaxID=45668 RepID=A0A845DN63_9BACI|nr:MULTISPECIES: hypothetical protein [Halobacillus]MCA1023411.1 hypothetical protein [Halobacillus litoralis]MYL19051.1 hypothetical protein [Halobacillus litoralis]MYL28199.1 hypothetical protein [Halobacillus halophilus]MYL37870.1 hypothetical protein [Halobacillus litoralis]